MGVGVGGIVGPYGSEIMKNSIFQKVFRIGVQYPENGLGVSGG